MLDRQDAQASTSRRREPGAAWAKAALLLAAAVLALSMSWVLRVTLRRADELERIREQQVAINGLHMRQRELAESILTETDWDDAVANLDLAWNRTWAQENMVQWEPYFQSIRIYDGADRLAFDYGRDLPASAGRELAWIDAELIGRVRARERARGPFAPRSGPSATVISTPIQETAAARVGGRLYLFTASLVQPDFGRALPHPRAPVVMAAAEVDSALLHSLSEPLLLPGLVLQPANAVLAPGFARVPVRDAQGAVAAWPGRTGRGHCRRRAASRTGIREHGRPDLGHPGVRWADLAG